MSAQKEDSPGTEGAAHIPVLLDEVLVALNPQAVQTFIDGTFGAGGYTRAMLARGASVIGIDRDPDAIRAGRDVEASAGGRLKLVHAQFSSLDELTELVDGVVLDIGVSSMQLGQAERGFSFRNDGPLDMRMGQTGPTAADVVNQFKVNDLIRIFGLLGEEKNASRIARMIERRRAERPFLRTLDLSQTIADHVGFSPRDKIHPATRIFQGLRIYVNDELGELSRALLAAERVLKPGGRLVVVTFHSLEDRMVKRFINDRSTQASGSRHMPAMATDIATFEKLGGMIGASDAEIEANPRSRSAKLRAAVRTDAPPRKADEGLFGLPRLPEIGSAER